MDNVNFSIDNEKGNKMSDQITTLYLKAASQRHELRIRCNELISENEILTEEISELATFILKEKAKYMELLAENESLKKDAAARKAVIDDSLCEAFENLLAAAKHYRENSAPQGKAGHKAEDMLMAIINKAEGR